MGFFWGLFGCPDYSHTLARIERRVTELMALIDDINAALATLQTTENAEDVTLQSIAAEGQLIQASIVILQGEVGQTPALQPVLDALTALNTQNTARGTTLTGYQTAATTLEGTLPQPPPPVK